MEVRPGHGAGQAVGDLRRVEPKRRIVGAVLPADTPAIEGPLGRQVIARVAGERSARLTHHASISSRVALRHCRPSAAREREP